MSKPEDIPEDVWDAAEEPAMNAFDAAVDLYETGIESASVRLIVARAILAERARWQPAVTYFNNYCLDEADDVENCVCGAEQHEHAKAFAAAIRAGRQ